MCRQQEGKSGRHSAELGKRGFVGVQVSFRAVKKNRAGVIAVSGEQQSILLVEQRDGVWRMPGSCDHLHHAPTQVNAVAIMEPMPDLKWPRGIGFGMEVCRQWTAKLASCNLRLSIGK